MLESLKQTHYLIKSSNVLNGPMLYVDDKKLAELLLSKSSVRFKQEMKLKIYETKERDHKRTSH